MPSGKYVDPFRLKVALLVAGVVAYAWLHKRATSGRPASPRQLGAPGLLLIALWLGVGLAGRFIGLI